jgi:hypothetical protein
MNCGEKRLERFIYQKKCETRAGKQTSEEERVEFFCNGKLTNSILFTRLSNRRYAVELSRSPKKINIKMFLERSADKVWALRVFKR